MKATTKFVGRLVAGCGLACCLALELQAQTNLQFTSVNATPEGAIQLHWASTSNAIYEIDYADSLIGTNTGTTTWNKLYTDYPSQGTNTFIGDFGNYNVTPPIPNPKYVPMRFYRVVMTGTNTGPAPTVTITSPTNGEVVSGDLTVTVNASSSQLLVQTILYVDGQAMPPSADGSNYVINTCEWWNGQHTLFAVAKSQSGLETYHDNTITYGSAVSPYINVTFSNLISEIAFSQPFFEPDLGETQEVTAQFAANCNWTLQIQDASSNTVRTVTGSGDSMTFDWDGTGDGGATIPNGVYYYLISVQTNGLANQVVTNGSGGNGGSSPPPSPSSASSDSTELWAMPTSGPGGVAPLMIYPPGYDTNNLTIFEASPTEIQALYKLASDSQTTETIASSTGLSADISMPSQTTKAPKRPPTNPVKGAVGSIGVAYQEYLPQGMSIPHGPSSGLPLQLYVAIDGNPAGQGEFFDYITAAKTIGDGFSQAMQKGGWKTSFIKGNNNVSATDLKSTSLGGNSIFNNVTIGMLLGHGSYGTTAEYDGVEYSYFWLWNSQNNSYSDLRLADFDFGGSDPTNGLRWMTIVACNMLNQNDFTSMQNNFRLPINDNLHLLNGVQGAFPGAPDIGTIYATNLLSGTVTIPQAWINAGKSAYSGLTLQNTVIFVTAGWPNCFSDRLLNYSSPNTGDTIQYQATQVYP